MQLILGSVITARRPSQPPTLPPRDDQKSTTDPGEPRANATWGESCVMLGHGRVECPTTFSIGARRGLHAFRGPLVDMGWARNMGRIMCHVG